MSLGRVFQKVEAATENERRPTVDRRYGGTSSCCVRMTTVTGDGLAGLIPERVDSALYQLYRHTFVPYSMQSGSRVYETVERPSVRPSVCLFHLATAAEACCEFAAERPAGRIYHQSIAGTGAQQHRRRSTALSSKCRQCRVDSRETRLNTDLFTSRLCR